MHYKKIHVLHVLNMVVHTCTSTDILLNQNKIPICKYCIIVQGCFVIFLIIYEMFSSLNQGQICACIVHFTIYCTIYYLHVCVQTENTHVHVFLFHHLPY